MLNLKREYKIPVESDDWITPEETLLDSGSEYSDIEIPISPVTFKLAFAIFSTLMGLVLVFTFNIGIGNHAYYEDLALGNRSVNFPIPPPRGIILDSIGTPLVKNLPSFDLLVISREVKENMAEINFEKISEILGSTPTEFKTFISSGARSSSTFFAAKDLVKSQVLSIKYLNPKGFYIIPSTRRYYVDGQQFSHIIGYVSKVNKDDLKDDYYEPTDFIGHLGIEAEYEKILRGEHGRIFFTSATSSQSDGGNKDPLGGNNLVLSIDYELQKKLYSELYGVLVSSGLSRGAAVIQNPQNGNILAMASFPSFDSNLFTTGLSESDFKRLFENKAKPLFNRVVSGLYNPGSTIKPLMGLMILAEHIFEPSDVIRDCISLTVPNSYGQSSGYVFKNWRAEHGLFNLRKAIANSCNVYFFIAGGGFGNVRGLGAEKIGKYLTSNLVDSILGIDLPGEEKGFVPTPDWKLKEKGENWYQGDTYNTSIGQGDLLVTPLWLNTYISAIANGGKIYKPMIAQRVTDDKNNTLSTFESQVIKKMPFSNEVLREVKSDMEETVISGTAGLLRDLPVRVGAKTGTAEVVKGKSINSLFTAFAPFENPELNITVLVEGSASNQGLAIRTAHNVLKWYFGERGKPSPTPVSSVVPTP